MKEELYNLLYNIIDAIDDVAYELKNSSKDTITDKTQSLWAELKDIKKTGDTK